jgi:hypothetical protein
MDALTELSTAERKRMLRKIADSEGFDKILDLLEHAVHECVSPGICLACDGVTTSHEPDACKNYCELCGANRVVAAPVLAGIL